MLLTGETKISWKINMRTGSQVGDTYLSTDLRSAVFLRPDATTEIGFARSSISGLLLCGFGILPPKVLGALHPNPARPFDPGILPHVRFCEVRLDRQAGRLATQWTPTAINAP